MVKVSVGVPVYNGEYYIHCALTSLVNQDERDIEIIVCDNASSDRTPEICRAFAERDVRIKYFRNDCNIGAGPNFNVAFQRASGSYFMWLAHDDWVSPNYVTECMRVLDAHPQAVLAFGRTECVDETGCSIPKLGVTLGELTDSRPAIRFGVVVSTPIPCFEVFGLIRSSALARSDLHRSYAGSDRALIAQLALCGTFLEARGAVLYNRDHPTRSIYIADYRTDTRSTSSHALSSRNRMAWQDSSMGTRLPLPRWRLSLHLASIIRRIAPRGSRLHAYLFLLRWMLKRYTLFMLAFDLIDAFSPRTAATLQRGTFRLWRRFRGDRRSQHAY